MAVEMHTGSRAAALAARDHVDPGMGVAVARRVLGADVMDVKAAMAQTLAEEFRAGAVVVPWRVHRRQADQRARQLDDVLAATLDLGKEAIADHRPSLRVTRASQTAASYKRPRPL